MNIRMSAARIAAVVCVALSSAPAWAGGASLYAEEIVNLGTPTPTHYNDGFVAGIDPITNCIGGTFTTTTIDPKGNATMISHGFIWNRGVVTALPTGTSLQHIAGGVATGIWLSTGQEFMWTPLGGITPMPSRITFTGLSPDGTTGIGCNWAHPMVMMIYNGGQQKFAALPNSAIVSGNSINLAGDIAGQYSFGKQVRAFALIDARKKFVDIGALLPGNVSSVAIRINGEQQVAGYTYDSSNNTHGFIYNPINGAAGVKMLAGLYPRSITLVTDQSEDGYVVGMSSAYPTTNYPVVPVVWDRNGACSSLPSITGWTFLSAGRIANGIVAGEAWHGNHRALFRLTGLIPEEATAGK